MRPHQHVPDPDRGTGVDRRRRAATEWRALQAALDRIGSSPADIDGIVLTHGHFDHVGLALRAHRGWQIPVWVHPRDRRLAAHPIAAAVAQARQQAESDHQTTPWS